MSVKYAVIESRDAFRAAAYAARVEPGPCVDRRALAAWIERTDCGLSEEQIATVLERLRDACLATLLEGGSVHFDGLFHLAPFLADETGTAAGFRAPTGRQFDLRATALSALREEFKAHAIPERRPCVPPGPAPVSYLDSRTGVRNGLLTPGGPGWLRGLGLKFHPDRTDEGVFFLSAGGETVRASVIHGNRPREIAFMNPPALRPGDYWIEVRARSANEAEPRRGRLAVLLSV